MRRLAEGHPLSLFLLFTFASSWTLWIASGVTSRTGEVPADVLWLVAQIGVFAPGLAALLVGSLARPEVRRSGSRILFGLYVPAVLLGAAFASGGFSDLRRVDAPWTLLTVLLAVAALIVLGSGRNRIEPWPLVEARGPAVARWTLGAVLAPVTVLAVGFLLAHPGEVPRTVVPAVPVRALTALGVLEALGFNLVFGGSLGEELGWRGFLLPAIAFHTVINAVADFALAAPARYEAAVAAFFVVALVLAVAVVAADPVMLRRPHREEVQTPRPPERLAG